MNVSKQTGAPVRLSQLALYLIPIAFALAAYGEGILAGYRLDDWIWLGQHRRVRSAGDLWNAVFSPSRHGTFRPFSERLPFLIFGRLFADDALAFRLLVFATHGLNLVLLTRLVRELTGSALAGFAAPAFWTVNAALTVVMTWCSSYMQALCGALLLTALRLFIRFHRTGDRRYYRRQWIPFLIGFGVMETTIVYPALALAYALLFAPRLWKATLPMFGASALFYGFHSWYAPKVAAGPYSMHFDASIARTFLTYWQWALRPEKLAVIEPDMAMAGSVAPWLFTAAIAAFLGWSLWRGQRAPLFFFLCFPILLAPVLPLRDHLTEYYLTLPALALGALLACGLAAAWNGAWLWRAVAVSLGLLFLACHWPVARYGAHWWRVRSDRANDVVRAVVDVRSRAPGKTILLADVSEALFADAVVDRAFQAVGVDNVFIDPFSAARLPRERFSAPPADFTLDPLTVRALWEAGNLVVYSTNDFPLRNISKQWMTLFLAAGPTRLPHRLQPGRVADALLGGGWRPAEHGFRWMGRRAALTLGLPAAGARQLAVRGFFPANQAAHGPVRLTASAAGRPLGTFTVAKPDAPYEALFDLPADITGEDGLEILLEVDRTFQAPPDPSRLGLVVDLVELR